MACTCACPAQDTYCSYHSPNMQLVQLHATLGCALPLTNIITCACTAQDTYCSYHSPNMRTVHVDTVQLHATLGCALPLTNIIGSRVPSHGLMGGLL